jgi:hypothetical protein
LRPIEYIYFTFLYSSGFALYSDSYAIITYGLNSFSTGDDSLIIMAGLYISLSCILLINSFLLIPISSSNLSSKDKKDKLNNKFSSGTFLIVLGHFERHSLFVPYSPS